MAGKLVKTLREAIALSGLKSGMSVSFHHHLRNGDYTLNMVMEEIAALGVEKREIKISYDVGDSVKITDGALESFIGTVEELDVERGKVRVVVSMFGRETPVELELDQVEPVKF